MRRDYFEVECSGIDEPSSDPPVIAITYEGPDGLLADRLTATSGTLDADELDVTYRLTNDGGETGVLSIANRLTGDFVLETNADPSTIGSLVGSVGDGDDTSYRIRITDSDGKSTIYEKEILLVYDGDGSLRRGESLIPGGVEL